MIADDRGRGLFLKGVVGPEGGDFGEIGVDALRVEPGEHLAVGIAPGFHADEVRSIGQH